MSADEALVVYSDITGTIVRVSGTEETVAGSGLEQTLLATGTVTPGVTSLIVNHISTPVLASIADLANHAGLFVVKDLSASNTTAHVATCTAGTWDGTTTIATLNGLNNCLAVWVDSVGNGTVLTNVGTVVLS